jgi:hypothetical protein
MALMELKVRTVPCRPFSGHHTMLSNFESFQNDAITSTIISVGWTLVVILLIFLFSVKKTMNDICVCLHLNFERKNMLNTFMLSHIYLINS